MTQTTTRSGANPDAEIIEKLTDAIVAVFERQRDLNRRRHVMCEELAALLCPFSKGERIRIPRPAHADGHDQGQILSIWFDFNCGYQLYLGYDDHTQGSVPAYMNTELELCNGKEPALPPKLREEHLRLSGNAWYSV